MDDEAPLRQLVTQFAKKAGCEAVTAGDGQAAMKCYDQSLMGGDPFDLIILDLTVPGGMGGLETLKKLREAGCRVPVIVSSGYSNDPVLADPEKYGFEGSLPKPFNLKAFKQALATRKSPSNG
jgi:CheY-like chemotaxis protein